MIITQARAVSVMGTNVMGAAHRINEFDPVWFRCQWSSPAISRLFNDDVGSRFDPTGKSLADFQNGLSSPLCKNISVFPNPKSDLYDSHPVPLRGALRNVNSAGRGCGGR
jgi:hypothetical protein